MALSKDNIFFKNYRGRLTEGITYNPSNDTLLWVDIIQAEVHRVSLSEESEHHYERTHEVIKVPGSGESVGAIGLTSDDNIVIICAKYGVAKGNFTTGEVEYILKYNHTPEQAHRLRSNDGIIDPWGHLWIGVMNDFPITAAEGVKPEGILYRVNCHDLSVTTMVTDVLISNGLAFSDDGKQLWWTDSLTHTIWQFDYDVVSNKLSNRRPFIETKKALPDFDSPEPDGLTTNTHDDIYSAVFGTSQVVHFDSKGQIVEKFDIPAKRPTCVIIGKGRLFVTTAHEHHEDWSATIDKNDLSGDLGGFLYQIKVEGLEGKVKNVWGGQVTD